MGSLFVYIGYILQFTNLIVYLSGFFKNGKAFKIFTIYIFVIFVIQVLTYLIYIQNLNNLFLSHYYFILQFILLSIFYISLFQDPAQKKLVKTVLFVGLLVLLIQYLGDPSLYNKFNLFEIFITSFMIIIYAAIHFYNILNSNKVFYFINMGVLIYLFGSTVLFLTGNLMASLTSKYNSLTWTMNAFLYIVYQIFILVEWWKSFSKNRTKLIGNEPG